TQPPPPPLDTLIHHRQTHPPPPLLDTPTHHQTHPPPPPDTPTTTCFLFSKHLIICTRGSGGKLHITKNGVISLIDCTLMEELEGAEDEAKPEKTGQDTEHLDFKVIVEPKDIQSYTIILVASSRQEKAAWTSDISQARGPTVLPLTPSPPSPLHPHTPHPLAPSPPLPHTPTPLTPRPLTPRRVVSCHCVTSLGVTRGRRGSRC
ncbi:hypothetical protein CRUP_018660, partial [Coryphaenoides rupestris]